MYRIKQSLKGLTLDQLYEEKSEAEKYLNSNLGDTQALANLWTVKQALAAAEAADRKAKAKSASDSEAAELQAIDNISRSLANRYPTDQDAVELRKRLKARYSFGKVPVST